MKARIHVNQHNIKYNKKNPSDSRPVFSIKTYKDNTYTDSIQINGPSKLVYSPGKPLSCGAHIWIECKREDLVIDG